MKETVFVFLLLNLLTLGLYAQEDQSVKNDSIVFEKTIHDYGTIIQGSDGNCEFVFTNNGKTPLILNNVSSSCGCTVPEWPRAPIEPGKTGIIKVKYDTGKIGGFTKKITVRSNAKNSTVILEIKGNVSAKL